VKNIYLILLVIIPFFVSAQKDVEILNDSFFIVSYNKVNSIKERTENLKKQVEILSKYAILCDTTTKKALSKEIWYEQELAKWKTMDSIYREKMDRSILIMNNYDKLITISNSKLEDAQKEIKKQRNWKNVYKPLALGGLLYIGLHILLK
jgi:hypothetical protein